MAIHVRRRGRWGLPRLIAITGTTAAAASLAFALLGALGTGTARAAAPPATGTLTASATSVANGTSITFSYSVPAAGLAAKNWVGIYQPGQVPGQVASATWQYTPDASGTVSVNAKSLGVGSWQAYYLYNDGYDVLAGPVSFTVTPGHLAAAPVYHKSIGRPLLSGPAGVAVGSNGTVWVADTGRNSVQRFSSGGLPLPSSGSGLGLSKPEGIATDAGGNVWVADTGSNRIVELDQNGRLLTAFGTAGSGNGQLNSPVGVAVGASTGGASTGGSRQATRGIAPRSAWPPPRLAC